MFEQLIIQVFTKYLVSNIIYKLSLCTLASTNGLLRLLLEDNIHLFVKKEDCEDNKDVGSQRTTWTDALQKYYRVLCRYDSARVYSPMVANYLHVDNELTATTMYIDHG